MKRSNRCMCWDAVMSAPAAEDLWPSLDESIGRQPCFPSGPVWSILPTLKGQMTDMLASIGSNERELYSDKLSLRRDKRGSIRIFIH